MAETRGVNETEPILTDYCNVTYRVPSPISKKWKIEEWLDFKKTKEGTALVLDEAGEESLFLTITSTEGPK